MKTTAQFIEQAKSVHDDRYDYSLVVYEGTHIKIKIGCGVHGVFEQKPYSHLRGVGCPQCAIHQRKQTNLKKYGVEHVLQHNGMKAKQEQTNLLRYGHKNAFRNLNIQQKQKQTMLERHCVEFPLQSEVVRDKFKQTMITRYGVDNPQKDKKMKEKTKITCLNLYGFENPSQNNKVKEKRKQTVVYTYGVEFPSQNEMIKKKTKLTNLEKYGVIHHLKLKTQVEKQTHTNITRYGGHPTQQHLLSILPYLEDADWLYDQYIMQGKTALQISAELNINDGTVGKYLRKAEIAIKQTFLISYKEIQILNYIMEKENIFIQHAQNGGQFKPSGVRRYVDGYCVETNTIYQVHGDYWHGNPKVFTAEEINEVCGKTMGDLYEDTLHKDEELRQLGYNLVVIWESDWTEEV